MVKLMKIERGLRDPKAIGGNESNGGSFKTFGDVWELVQELGLNHQPEILLFVPLSVQTKPLEQKLLEMLLLVQHELGIRHHEIVLPRLFLLQKNFPFVRNGGESKFADFLWEKRRRRRNGRSRRWRRRR